MHVVPHISVIALMPSPRQVVMRVPLNMSGVQGWLCIRRAIAYSVHVVGPLLSISSFLNFNLLEKGSEHCARL